MKYVLSVLVLSVAAILNSTVCVADRTEDLFQMSLEELMNIQFSVASIKAKPIREQPAIVTIITAAEISQSGARDLEDKR